MGLGLAPMIAPLLENLQQTLTPEGVLGMLEAERQRQAEALAQRSQEAAGAASQAGAAYQTAAAAPPPQLAPMEMFIPSLLSNIASVLGGEPSYRENTQQRLQMDQKQLVQNRLENLTALRDVWQQKARVAESANDLEAQEKARGKIAQLDKTFEAMMQRQNQQANLDRQREGDKAQRDRQELEGTQRLQQIAATGAEQRKTQAARPLKTAGERAALARQGFDPDTELILPTFATQQITQRSRLAKTGDEKSKNEAVNTIRDIAYQRWSNEKTEAQMGLRLLKLRHPFYRSTPKDERYFVTDEKVYRKRNGKWEIDLEAERRAKAAINDLVAPYFEQTPTPLPTGAMPFGGAR